jgi:AcrR family transcriptional regulator
MPRPRVRTDALRGELLDGAIQLVAERGTSALTTRSLAASVGTSLASVDELFGGKAGLWRAMFVEGFERLATALESLPEPADASAGVLDTAGAFRQFAATHRRLYEMMFSQPYSDFEVTADDLDGYLRTGRVVLARVNALFDRPTPRSTREDAALAVTATFHGLARLELAGTLGTTERSRARRWRVAVLATIRGLQLATAEPSEASESWGN